MLSLSLISPIRTSNEAVLYSLDFHSSPGDLAVWSFNFVLDYECGWIIRSLDPLLLLATLVFGLLPVVLTLVVRAWPLKSEDVGGKGLFLFAEVTLWILTVSCSKASLNYELAEDGNPLLFICLSGPLLLFLCGPSDRDEGFHLLHPIINLIKVNRGVTQAKGIINDVDINSSEYFSLNFQLP
ncbi:hypothetical protein TNIN_228881 [Trichonephila inaurata madagascariensis]|uniref:Uncharacterized protein n=1 Tax=Trichonephila inaurata madagascariensis TaxID=2747483 RepID=A0A8X7C919_9ARAC|nr:hypothetical protein TNIN_228881 [Trichonephila inaurata madagascariensis]